MRASVSVGVTEGVVDGKHRSVLRLGDRNLDGATGVEALVQIHALVVEDALQQAALEHITATDQEPFSPAVFSTEHILVSGEGVGDEVACEGDAVLFGKVPIVGGCNTQLGRQLELVGTLDHRPLQGAVRVEVGLE